MFYVEKMVLLIITLGRHTNDLQKCLMKFFIADIEIGFLPWLMNEVEKTMEHSMVGRTVLDSKLLYIRAVPKLLSGDK